MDYYIWGVACIVVFITLIWIFVKGKAQELTSFESRVQPHGKIKQFFSNIWLVEGSLPRMGLPRNMTIIKLPSNEIVLHSVIALEEKEMKKLESLGTISYFIVPNKMHTYDLQAYQRKYIHAKVVNRIKKRIIFIIF